MSWEERNMMIPESKVLYVSSHIFENQERVQIDFNSFSSDYRNVVNEDGKFLAFVSLHQSLLNQWKFQDKPPLNGVEGNTLSHGRIINEFNRSSYHIYFKDDIATITKTNVEFINPTDLVGYTISRSM